MQSVGRGDRTEPRAGLDARQLARERFAERADDVRLSRILELTRQQGCIADFLRSRLVAGTLELGEQRHRRILWAIAVLLRIDVDLLERIPRLDQEPIAIRGEEFIELRLRRLLRGDVLGQEVDLL